MGTVSFWYLAKSHLETGELSHNQDLKISMGFLFIGLTLLLSSAYAEDSKPKGWDEGMVDGSCPEHDFEENFDTINYKEYPGTWFQVKHYADVARSIRPNCRNMTMVMMNTEDGDRRIKMLLTDQDKKDGSCKKNTVMMYQKHPDTGLVAEDGAMFGIHNGKDIAKYRIIDIDFEKKYYLTYNCLEAEFNGEIRHNENVFVDTRARAPGQEVLDAIDQAMVKAGLGHFLSQLNDKDHKDNQNDCHC